MSQIHAPGVDLIFSRLSASTDQMITDLTRDRVVLNDMGIFDGPVKATREGLVAAIYAYRDAILSEWTRYVEQQETT